MFYIHLVDGESGGVGKSFFSRVLIEYFQFNQKNFTLFDVDNSKFDVGRLYEPSSYELNCSNNNSQPEENNKVNSDAPNYQPNVSPQTSNQDTVDNKTKIYFTADKKRKYEVDKLFESAREKDVIVNLPSNVFYLVKPWIENNGLIELGKAQNIKFIKWFVCSGSYDSMELFKKSLDSFNSDDFSHILVQNEHHCDDWDDLLAIESEFSDYLDTYDIKSLEFPELSYKARNQVDKHSLKFQDAQTSNQLGLIDRQRIKNFLTTSFANIESILKEIK